MIVRKQFPLLLSEEERSLYETYAKMKGWTISKALRITSRALIQAEINKISMIQTLSSWMLKVTPTSGPTAITRIDSN